MAGAEQLAGMNLAEITEEKAQGLRSLFEQLGTEAGDKAGQQAGKQVRRKRNECKVWEWETLNINTYFYFLTSISRSWKRGQVSRPP